MERLGVEVGPRIWEVDMGIRGRLWGVGLDMDIGYKVGYGVHVGFVSRCVDGEEGADPANQFDRPRGSSSQSINQCIQQRYNAVNWKFSNRPLNLSRVVSTLECSDEKNSLIDVFLERSKRNPTLSACSRSIASPEWRA